MRHRARQCGLSLVELLAGIVVGLLVVLAAFGSLLPSRSASAGVAELSQLQHQGAYALHVMGLQLRQAGAVDASRDEASGFFRFDAEALAQAAAGAAVSGTDGAAPSMDSVTVGFAPAAGGDGSASTPSAQRHYDCTGMRVDGQKRLIARFEVNPQGQLTCSGLSRKQPLVGQVADFRVSYLVDTAHGMQYMNAGAIVRDNLWGAIRAIEVCLDLYGKELIAGADGAYQGCDEAEPARDNRVHLVLRNSFALRAR